MIVGYARVSTDETIPSKHNTRRSKQPGLSECLQRSNQEQRRTALH